jgi:shikimate dehydrogenase
LHSLSPILHTSAYRHLGLNWRYHALECDEDRLQPLLAEHADWAGFSCTMPLKRVLLDVADEIRPLARAVGAGNTLLPGSRGGWIADNTDVHGVVAAIRESGVAPRTVTVLGAGGTAQAVIAALPEFGIDSCAVLVRDSRRTSALRGTAERIGILFDVGDLALDAPGLDQDLIISTLPGDAADVLAMRRWRPDQAVLDVRYDPWPTPLAEAADRAGARVISGALMLLYQAARQVELMTDRRAPVDVMRAALRAARPAAGV